MDRRDLIKLPIFALFATATLNAYDKSKIKNTQKMKIQDPKNPTKAELKHTPDIKVSNDVDKNGYVRVDVTVGKDGIIHPSTQDHWIYKIELYADGKLVSKVDLEPEISRGYLSARVKKDGLKELKAIASCNLHGDWESSITL